MKKLTLFLTLSLFALVLRSQENAYPLRSTIWNQDKISVCWDNPTEENRALRELVKQAIKETWEKHSALEFTDWVPAAEKDGDIHIYINDEGPHTKGLGTQIKNKPRGMVLNFTFNNWSTSCRFDNKEFCIKAIAVHEFGHALGFAHEQNRSDCEFFNCLGREQGTDGDWYITPCDINSIMNYCNPRWNNRGLLSELDVKALQYLYGVPRDKSNPLQHLQIVHTSNQLREPKRRRISHEFKVYLVGEKEILDEVEKVVYHLHPTFKSPNMTNSLRQNNFGIGLKVWGEFAITADVYKKDGSIITLARYLDFDGNREKSN